jgi:hypothetical protein
VRGLREGASRLDDKSSAFTVMTVGSSSRDRPAEALRKSLPERSAEYSYGIDVKKNRCDSQPQSEEPKPAIGTDEPGIVAKCLAHWCSHDSLP